MFNKILLCVDGSACALDAARSAALIAQHFRSNVLALNVFRFSYADTARLDLWPIALDQEAINEAARESMRSITCNIKNIFEPLNIPVRFDQEAGFEPEVDAILGMAERERADLIILGSRGLRGAKELLLGSVSIGVLHHAQCPVLLVHGQTAGGETRAFRKIVLASDGSPCAQKAAKVAVEIAQKFSTPLTVLNAYEDLAGEYPLGHGDDIVSDANVDLYARQWLDYVANPVRELAKTSGVDCDFVQEVGFPDEIILSYAAEHAADLIVLGSRGLRGYQRMLLGSVSNRVVHQAICPVLVVR